MSIKEYKISNLCDTSNPKTFKKFAITGVPIYKISNFMNDNNFKYISYDEYLNIKIKPSYQDIFISRVGTIGEIFQKCNSDPIYLSDNFIWLTNLRKDIIIPKFFYYKLVSIKNNFKSMNSGSTQPLLVKSKVLSTKIKIPTLIKQQEIIDIIEPFEKILNQEYEKLNRLNLLLENLSNWLKNNEKISFLSLVNFCGSGYNNQTKYIDTSNISKSLLKGYEIINENKKSRANMTPEKNSIIFSKLKGENKIYPIYSDEEKEYVFSTGFENIKSDYNSYIYGIMLSNSFHEYKNISCSGSVMAGLTKAAINNWEISDINKERWNDNFNNILKLVSLTNKKINTINTIIKNLIEKYVG